MSYDLKNEIMHAVRKHADSAETAAELNTMPLSASLRGALLEILSVC